MLHRRLARDCETHPHRSEAVIRLAETSLVEASLEAVITRRGGRCVAVARVRLGALWVRR